jgi:hypothetical protein
MIIVIGTMAGASMITYCSEDFCDLPPLSELFAGF